jgi:predicted alpha-1,2-mannosidase
MRVRSALMLASALAACGDNGEPPLPEVTSAASQVDPRIGTGGLGYAHGSCFVGPSAPHGLAKPGPDTSGLFGTINFQHYSGYFAEDDRIRGFSSLHLHGTGATDYGVLSLMPTLAFDPAKPKVTDYETRFDKADESVAAGYYQVTLANEIGVELTATTHVALHRYTMPAPGTIVIDLKKVLEGGEVDSSSIVVDAAARELTGQLHHLGGMTDGYGGYTVYFVIRAEQPWLADALTDVGAALSIDAGSFSLAIGLSLVSLEGARKNLDAEAPTVEFDAVRSNTFAAWDELLGVVKLTGGTPEQRHTFYTSLYHTFLMPTTISDVDGAFQLAGHAPAQASGYAMLSDLSLWDTYRTVSPLHAWLAPTSARNTARSLVTFGQQLGIYPKWPLAIGETGTMLGSSAEIVIADAVTRGVTDTHAEEAWPLLRAAAMDPIAPPMGRGGRNDVGAYLTLGYVPLPTNRSVSVTAEYAHDDFALAQLAAALGHAADHDALADRARGWRSLYDPDAGFLRAKNADGSFSSAALDPLVWDDDYAEANAWQSLFEPGIHDPDGIAEILGGAPAAIAKLSTFFDKAKQDWENSDESAANFPRTYYWAGNETDLNAAFLFAQLGRPDLTQQWVRWLVDTMYSDLPSGVPGNDDGGTMGAWYVLATLGLYPIAGSDQWILGAPRFPRARITVDGHELVIEAQGSGAYVASVLVDGAPLDAPQLTHAQLTAAYELTFVMSSEPTRWGAGRYASQR